MTKFIVKLFIFITIPTVLILLINFFIPYNSLDRKKKQFRNPYFRRGWPEYTNATVSIDDKSKKMIIISNSQGFGREFIGNKTYTSQLQARFKKDGKQINVINWSAPGAIAHDLLLLTAKSLVDDVDCVLIITFCENFRKRDVDKPLSYSAQDTPYMLTNELVRSILPDSIIELADVKHKMMILSLFYRGVEYFKDMYQKYHSNKETYWWSYPENGPGHRKTIAEKDVKKSVEFSDYDVSYFQYFDVLFQKKNKTKVVFVMMPLASRLLTEGSIKKIKQFNSYVMNHYKSTDIDVWNMSNELDEDHFYSHTHFSPTNHLIFSELLYRKLDKIFMF
jgi:hypothetical protein